MFKRKNESEGQFFRRAAAKPHLWPSTFPARPGADEQSGQSHTGGPCSHRPTAARSPLPMRRVPLVPLDSEMGKTVKSTQNYSFLSPKGLFLLWSVTGVSIYRAVIISAYKPPITCPGDSCSPVVGQPGQTAWQTHRVTGGGDKYDIPSSLEPRETLISNRDLKI